MAPNVSDDVLAADLAETVRRIFFSDDRDALTVNEVRKQVETKHKLEDRFFKSNPEWNIKSRDIIKVTVVCTRLPYVFSLVVLTAGFVN